METAIRLPKKRKVPAVKNACIHCRLAKRACDFQRPCARCKQKQLFCTILPPNQIHIPSTSQPTPTDPSSSTSLSPQQASGSFPIFTFHVDSKGPTHTTHTSLNTNKSLSPQQQQQQQPPYYYPPSSTLYTLPTGDTIPIPLDTSPDLPVVIEEQPNDQQEQQQDQQNSQQQNQQNQQQEQQQEQQPAPQIVTIKKCGGACGCACERMMMKQSLEMPNASSSIPSTNQYDLEWLSSGTDLSFIPDSPIHEPLGVGPSDEKTTTLLEKHNQLLEKLITMNISKEQAQNGSKSLDPNTHSKFSPYSLWEISTQRLIACNNSFQHMVGYNMEDLTTKFYIYQLVPDRYINDQKRLWDLMSTLKNKVEMKLCLKAKDGREICVCTSMLLMPDKLHVMMEHTPMEFCDDKWSIGEFTHFPTYRLTPQQCKHTAQNIYEIWKVFNTM